MSRNSNVVVTAPGAEMPQEPTSLGPQGSPVRSSNDPKTTGVPAQASVGTHVGVQRCAQPKQETGNAGDNGNGMVDNARGLKTETATQKVSIKERLLASARKKRKASPIPETGRSDLDNELLEDLEGIMTACNEAVYEAKMVTSTVLDGDHHLVELTSTVREMVERLIEKRSVVNLMSEKNSPQRVSKGGHVGEDKATQTGNKKPVMPSKREADGKGKRKGKIKGSLALGSKKADKAPESCPETKEATASADAPNAQNPTPWTQVVGRKAKVKAPANAFTGDNQLRPPAQRDRRAEAISLLKRRVPKSAAVVIQRPSEEGETLTSVMKKVSNGVNLTELDVKILNTRRTKTGGILLEVGSQEEANALADKVRKVVGNTARVNLPERRTPVLLLDVPDWLEEEEVRDSLHKAGVDPGELGEPGSNHIVLRDNPGGRGGRVVRINVSFSAAIKLAEAKAVVVGWTKCRVKLLEKKQPTCYRCQGKGHLAAGCKSPERRRQCYSCKSEDHLARDCSARKTPSSSREAPTVAKEAPTSEEMEVELGQGRPASPPLVTARDGT